MLTLRDELEQVIQERFDPLEWKTKACVAVIFNVLRKYPDDLLELACVRKPSLPVHKVSTPSGVVEVTMEVVSDEDDHYGDSIPKEDADLHRSASAYFKDDP